MESKGGSIKSEYSRPNHLNAVRGWPRSVAAKWLWCLTVCVASLAVVQRAAAAAGDCDVTNAIPLNIPLIGGVVFEIEGNVLQDGGTPPPPGTLDWASFFTGTNFTP